MKKILTLLEQIIEVQQAIDKKDIAKAIKEHQGCSSLGNSWMITYLNNLKELVLEEDQRLENILQPNFEGKRK